MSLTNNNFLASKLPITDINLKKESTRFNNWLETGNYNGKICGIDDDNFITHFGKCSTLPLIKVLISKIEVTSICDSGAARSCFSSNLAMDIWGENFIKTLDNCEKLRLKDVNNQYLQILGTKTINFKIGAHDFTHKFVFYTSQNRELLLGIDFFKENKIGIFPNFGLQFENEKQILKLGVAKDPIFEMFIQEELCLSPNAQQVIRVSLKLLDDDPQKNMLINTCLVAHSENMQPDIELDQLNVFFQYVRVDANLETDILICNHTDDIIYYRACSLIAHAEPIKQVATIGQIQGDPLAHCLFETLKDIDGCTLSIPESRICIDLPEENPLQMDKINCHSLLADDKEWLYAQHKLYQQIFSTHDWDVGTCKGSQVHFEVKSKASICHQRFSRINPKIKGRADEIIAMLIGRKLIEISSSPWSSNILFVEKAPEDAVIKDGKGIPGKKSQKATFSHRLPKY